MKNFEIKPIYALLSCGVVALLMMLCTCLTSALMSFYAYHRYATVSQISNPVTANSQVDELTRRVTQLELEQTFQLKELAWALDQKLIIFGGVLSAITAILAFLGWNTYKDLDGVIRDRVKSSLDNALYQLDPLNLRVWVISYEKPIILKHNVIEGKQLITKDVLGNVSDEMGKVKERISLTGFPQPRELKQLDFHCYDGVTVLPVLDLEMEEGFFDFVTKNKDHLNASKAAFVLYTREHRVQTKTLDAYANVGTANMLPTVASMLITVARGLTDSRIKNESD